MSLRSVDAQILRRKYQKTLHYKHNGINCTSFKQLVNQGYLQQNIYNLLDWIKVWDYGHLL